MLGSNGHLAIWLHGYPDGHPQSLKNSPNLPETAHCENGHTKKKTRFWLPKADWFQKLLQAQKVPQVCEYHNRPFLKALAWVRMGVVWKNKLTQLTTEELQGFKFFQFPTDFFPLTLWMFWQSMLPFRWRQPDLTNLSEMAANMSQEEWAWPSRECFPGQTMDVNLDELVPPVEEPS